MMNENLIDYNSIGNHFFQDKADAFEQFAADADDGVSNTKVAVAKEIFLDSLENDLEDLIELIDKVKKTSLKKLKEEYL